MAKRKGFHITHSGYEDLEYVRQIRRQEANTEAGRAATEILDHVVLEGNAQKLAILKALGIRNAAHFRERAQKVLQTCDRALTMNYMALVRELNSNN